MADTKPRPRDGDGNGEGPASLEPPHPDTLMPYDRTIRALSDRIVEAQRPIRVLDAVKWGDDVEARFFEKGATELPEVSREYYERNAFPFDPETKYREFYDIERDPGRGSSMLPRRQAWHRGRRSRRRWPAGSGG